MQNKELNALLQENGYYNIRFLPDGVVANLKLLYTTALCIDLDESGYQERFCFPDSSVAEKACAALSSIHDNPSPGFIAYRGNRHIKRGIHLMEGISLG